jgi:transcriptional antiterminator RfaH
MNLWYVIQTKPKEEGKASAYLSDKGVEILSPLIETFVTRNAKTSKEMRPLFPGYIFGNFDLDINYPLVRWARGVKAVLGFGGYPTPVEDEVVKVIKMRTDSNGIVRLVKQFESNDVIRIASGPMKDLLGIFERWVSDTERVRVLLNLIGFQPAVEMHYSMIEKVA